MVSAQLALVMPVLLLILLTGLQFALHLHATHIAQSIAVQALTAARAAGGTAADGVTEGQRLLTNFGTSSLREPVVLAERGEERATVSVTGVALRALPLWNIAIHAEASGPVERLTSPEETGGAP